MELTKFVEANLTTVDRADRARLLDSPKLTYAAGVVYGIFQRESGTTTTSIVPKTGKYKCSCEDFLYNKTDRNTKILCKHTLRVIGDMDMDILEQFSDDKKDITSVVPTGIKAIDEQILFGGFPTHYNTVVYADWEVGKSVFLFQVAVYVSYKTGKPVIYLDAENNWISKEQRHAWLDRFAKRFGQKERAKVLFVYPRSLTELYAYFGLNVNIINTGTVRKFVSSDGIKGETIVVSKDSKGKEKKTKKIEYWSETDNPAINAIKQYNSPLLIVDSLSYHLKGAVPVPPNENQPQRARAMDILANRSHFIAASQGIPVVFAAHLSKDKTKQYSSANAYGDSGVGYNTKFLIYLKGGKADVSRVGFVVKTFHRSRTPAFPDAEVNVKLILDYGFADFDDPNAPKAKKLVKATK